MAKLLETEHVKIRRVKGYNEYRVFYKGLHKLREEATAYYTDDLEDAVGTAEAMEEWSDNVFDADIADFTKWPERKEKQHGHS